MRMSFAGAGIRKGPERVYPEGIKLSGDSGASGDFFRHFYPIEMAVSIYVSPQNMRLETGGSGKGNAT